MSKHVKCALAIIVGMCLVPALFAGAIGLIYGALWLATQPYARGGAALLVIGSPFGIALGVAYCREFIRK